MLNFRQRLVLTHWTVIVVIVACSALAGWWQLSRLVHGQLDAALLTLADTEAGMQVESHGQPVRVHERPPGSAPPSLVRLDRLVQIVNARGEILARSSNLGDAMLPAPPALLDELASGGQAVFQTLPSFGEEPLRMVSLPAVANGKPVVIQVAGSLDDVHNVLESATILFGIMAAALLAAVGAAGSVLTRRAFRGINDVVKQARLIGDANLGERLPHPGTTDEIGQLVDTLNAMLDRLEQAFDQQRRFTADASHELRSPLSRLRTEIEVTLRRPRESQEYVDTLRSCLDEVGRLTRLIEELLMLPVAVPGLATALGLILLYGGWQALRTSWVFILIGHVLFTLPFMVRSVLAILSAIDIRTIEDAAASLGATRLQRFFTVVLPNCRQGILAGALMVVTLSVGEFNLTWMLHTPTTQTLPVGLADSYASMRLEIGSAYTIVFFVMIIPLLVFMQALSALGARARRHAPPPEATADLPVTAVPQSAETRHA